MYIIKAVQSAKDIFFHSNVVYVKQNLTSESKSQTSQDIIRHLQLKRWKNSCCKKIHIHPFPPCSTFLSAETLDMHCSVVDHRRHCYRLFGKKPTHRTELVTLDLTAAFENVDHQQLLDCVYNTNIPATICRWLNNYMQNRRAKVHFRQQESKSRYGRQELCKVEFYLQRSSITIWLTFKHCLRT